MTSNDQHKLNAEFQLFNQNKELTEPPAHLFNKIQTRLSPKPWRVFVKVLALHTTVGFFSLGICNQFGLNPFHSPYSLADLFMKLAGHHFCMVACGALYLSTSYLFAALLLSKEELRSLRQHPWLQGATLCLASLSLFYFLGAELIGTFVGLWLIGATFGGILSTQITRALQSHQPQIQ